MTDKKLADLLHEPIPDTYACQACGRRDGLDAVVPDVVWEQISGGLNLLCLWCIDRRCHAAGISVSASLHFAGLAITATSERRAPRQRISKAERKRLRREHEERERRAKEEADYRSARPGDPCPRCDLMRWHLERLQASGATYVVEPCWLCRDTGRWFVTTRRTRTVAADRAGLLDRKGEGDPRAAPEHISGAAVV